MRVRIAALLSLGVLLAGPAAAQQYRSVLRGTVFNPDNTPAAGMSFRITSEQTGESRRFVSDPEGRYVLAGLLPGTYRIDGEDERSRGFAVRTSLSVNQELDLHLRLGVVPISVSADVRSTFLPIDRHSPAVTTRLDGDFLRRLPLDGRNLQDVVLLAPGVAPGSTGLTVNGTSDQSTAYLVDGIYDIDPRSGMPIARVPIDAISELEVRTSTYDASFGRTLGGQVNAITRSGSNRPGGGAFGFLQPDGDTSQLGVLGGGPLVVDRTYVFGTYQHTSREDTFTNDEGHLLTGRLDHILQPRSRITARYGFDRGVPFDRTGHNLGLAVHTVPSSSITNETRAGVSRLGLSDRAGDFPGAESTAYQFANATTWSTGAHLVTAGAEWFGSSNESGSSGPAANTWALLVQDEWRVLPSVAVSAGIRYDGISPEPDLDVKNRISPRVGFAWTVNSEAQTVVRGGYGVYQQSILVEQVADGWSLGAQRQIGRSRAFEVAYVGTRVEDLFGRPGTTRYDALQMRLQQRSDSGITALAAYTYGKWTEDPNDGAESLRAALDSRHRLTTAFVASLPFGEERRWFSTGLGAMILRDMELSGVFTLQSGRPVPGLFDEQGPGHRNVDVAVLKNVAMRDRGVLQLRLETFNLTNRENWGRGRRYQLGARFDF
jgi:hypothetical protein